jgi:hypothetical protein
MISVLIIDNQKSGGSIKGSSTERTAQWFRLCAMSVAVAVLVAVFASASSGQGKSAHFPELGDCDNLQVPTGNKVFFHVYAAGVQIYRWNGTSWVFIAPEAGLSANLGGDGLVGIHYAGPTWESLSGSKVVGVVDQRCTVSSADIQWLLLRAVSSTGPGIFQDVTYIQRLNTSGGVAPATPGTTVGQLALVPYITDYYFYREHP